MVRVTIQNTLQTQIMINLFQMKENTLSFT